MIFYLSFVVVKRISSRLIRESTSKTIVVCVSIEGLRVFQTMWNGGMPPSEARELKQLREENAKLKRLVADLSLDRVMLQDVVQKNSEACQAA